MGDIFDLKDLSDLPLSVSSSLSVSKLNPVQRRIKELFIEAARPLVIDEVMVAYCRRFQAPPERKKMMAILYNISRSKNPWLDVVRGRKGMYSLSKTREHRE